ncbi:AAA family ATPase [Nostoc sp. 'Lobaria pulmonaria (5183) cyanobiont']|uniref:AAA family ATPase n=1 Tax=Nostoc sp. 'Lobaria pulmonaria (5183) cyanobiont' TaxID=1618022 RepID=UPI000CF33E36|nr:ATP-binding protein [Nostoc sp. 'Lobaria pulmonaria (5183) cyanobiont']AVH69680.1 abortive phage infection protein RloA [Nostoc sp. 'Lobaria pulmonaria (5183) cyanobiont']
MLVDFTVENYRSIKEPVTLSAVAQKQSDRQTIQNSKRKRVKSDHEIAPGYHVEGWDIELLPVLAIFGANASGKSNVIQALDYLLLIMTYGTQEAVQFQRIFKYAKLDPFKLDRISAQKPTRFELRTLFNNNIYTYSIVINKNNIISENLDYALNTTKRTRRLFHRQWDESNKKFIWKTGDDFAGAHNQLQDNIRENELFLSTLVKLKVDIIESFINWLGSGWRGISLGSEDFDHVSITVLQDASIYVFNELLKQALNIIQKFDTGVSRIELKKKSDAPADYNIYAVHKTNDGNEIQWLFDEESLGTQRLFYLAFRIVVSLNIGGLIIVDELGTNIHPNIVKSIIRIFQNLKTNPRNAQLILTSHDNTLQRNNLLRRDQIWFTQKRSDQSTELYPLTDFHVRNDLAIDKAYLDGRFGAVPFLPSEEEMILQSDEQCQES